MAPEVFLDFSPHERAAREPRNGEKEKPLVTLDLNLPFMTIDPGQVGQKMSLSTTRVERLAAYKHVIAKLPLVPFLIIKLTRLTAGVCLKVRFRPNVTRCFSFSPLCDSCSRLRGSLAALSWDEKSRKTSVALEYL